MPRFLILEHQISNLSNVSKFVVLCQEEHDINWMRESSKRLEAATNGVLWKKSVLENLTKFTGKHLRWRTSLLTKRLQ